MQKYAHDRLPTDERPFRKKSRTTSLRFLLPKLALVLLVAAATATMAIQSAYACDGNNGQGNGVAASGKKKPSGIAAVTLLNEEATLTRFTLSGAPKNVPLIIHINAANTADTSPAGLCSGPELFVLKNTPGGQQIFKTNGQGKFSIDQNNPLEFKLVLDPNLPPPDLSQFDTWYVNVHDALPNGKFASIACGLIKVGTDPTKGTAKLKPDAAVALAKPVPDVVPDVVRTVS